MVSKNEDDEQRRCVLCNDGRSDWSKMHHLAEAVNDHKSAGALLRIGGKTKG
uniref:Uncharacterized protein n=1 Tax=Peronospora matthiolae TaxID=2874970 RepID=A0AAV1TD11_9STRA